MVTQTKKKTLEDVITKAFYDSVPNVCEFCERKIFYEKYGEPIEFITEAVKTWVLEQFNSWANDRIGDYQEIGTTPSFTKIEQLQWAKVNLERILNQKEKTDDNS